MGYKGGAYIKTPDDRFSLKLNVRAQSLFSYQDLENREDTATFRVRRARILAGGNAFYQKKFDRIQRVLHRRSGKCSGQYCRRQERG